MQILPVALIPLSTGFPESFADLWGSTPADLDISPPLDVTQEEPVSSVVEEQDFTLTNTTLFTPEALITPASSEDLTTTETPIDESLLESDPLITPASVEDSTATETPISSEDNSVSESQPATTTATVEEDIPPPVPKVPETATEPPTITPASPQNRKEEQTGNDEPQPKTIPPVESQKRKPSPTSSTPTTTVQKKSSKSPAPSQSAIEIVAKRHLQITQPECGAEIGSFWQYGDLPLDWVDVETAAECCELCDDKKECYKWSFGLTGKFTKRCYLKKGSAYSEAREQFISGYSTMRGTRPEDGEL